jgi:cellulose synthase/poly-beta-1,6-N-acetylglucosamine synthase-like glycosyltransferase
LIGTAARRDLQAVDVVLPCFNESPLAVRRTLEALHAQTHPPARIILVDDCSSDDAALKVAEALGVTTLRMSRNSGISAARNQGLQQCTSPLVACVNVEVLLRPEWLETCASYLEARTQVGVVASRTVPEDQSSIVTRWRMLYHEAPYPTRSGPIPWASGHAMLFRRDALLGVGGYDERRWKAGEDLDACFRLAAAGWEVHFVAETEAISIQEDAWGTIARAEYNRSIYRAERGNGLLRGFAVAADRCIQRSARHVIFLRWPLLVVEVGVFFAQVPRIWRHR